VISALPPTPSPAEESLHSVVILSATGTAVVVLLVAVFVKKRYCDGESTCHSFTASECSGLSHALQDTCRDSTAATGLTEM
jgi:hypothetical protein